MPQTSHPCPQPERRRARRFAMAEPVVFDVGRGVTGNVSRTGVFVETRTALEPRTHLAFTLLLPPRAHGLPPTRVGCWGEVTRVGTVAPGRWGAGIAFTHYGFDLDSDPSPAPQ